MSEPARSDKACAGSLPRRAGRSRLPWLLGILLVVGLLGAGYLIQQRRQLAAESQARDKLKSVRAMIGMDSEQKHVASLAMALPGVREQAAEQAENISRLTHLVHLDLSDTNFTDQDLRHLAPLSQLKSLVLNRTAVGDQGLSYLTELPIETLNLRGTPISAGGLRTIAGIKTINVLDLSETAAVDDLSPLLQLENLTWLVVSGVRLSDEALATVRQMPALARLTAIDSDISEQALQRLRDERPTLDVQLASTITVPESAADEASSPGE
jgi:hypothetical protein